MIYTQKKCYPTVRYYICQFDSLSCHLSTQYDISLRQTWSRSADWTFETDACTFASSADRLNVARLCNFAEVPLRIAESNVIGLHFARQCEISPYTSCVVVREIIKVERFVLWNIRVTYPGVLMISCFTKTAGHGQRWGPDTGSFLHPAQERWWRRV